MIDADPLPDRPPSAVDADEWSYHHRVLYRLVVGVPGSRTPDLLSLYDAVAPVAYRGTLETPTVSSQWRRKLLRDLHDAGMVTVHDTPGGLVWKPAEDADDAEDLAERTRDAEVSPTDV